MVPGYRLYHRMEIEAVVDGNVTRSDRRTAHFQLWNGLSA